MNRRTFLSALAAAVAAPAVTKPETFALSEYAGVVDVPRAPTAVDTGLRFGGVPVLSSDWVPRGVMHLIPEGYVYGGHIGLQHPRALGVVTSISDEPGDA